MPKAPARRTIAAVDLRGDCRKESPLRDVQNLQGGTPKEPPRSSEDEVSVHEATNPRARRHRVEGKEQFSGDRTKTTQVACDIVAIQERTGNKVDKAFGERATPLGSVLGDHDATLSAHQVLSDTGTTQQKGTPANGQRTGQSPEIVSKTLEPPAKRRRIQRVLEKGPGRHSSRANVPPSAPEDHVHDESLQTNFINAEPYESEGMSGGVETAINPDRVSLTESTAGQPNLSSMNQALSQPATPGRKSGSHSRTKQSNEASSIRGGDAVVERMAAAVIADAVQTPVVPKRRERRRHRESTPEGAENVQIESSAVKMVDLCRDVRTGKRSLIGKELQVLDEKTKTLQRQARRAKKDIAGETATDDPDNAEKSPEARGGECQNDQITDSGLETEQDGTFDTVNGPGMLQPATRIVNGEIVLDESSLRIDRHANATANQIGRTLDVIEESDLTRHTTAGSWLKRDKGGSWGAEYTELFYEGLRMFGTDFGMISKMFSDGRSRHAIKRKFCLEEKLYPKRIEATLRGERVPIDLEEFSERTNTIYEDPQELERDMAEDRKRLEEEQARERDALEEARQKRAEEAAAENAAVEVDPSTAGSGRRRRKRIPSDMKKPSNARKSSKGRGKQKSSSA